MSCLPIDVWTIICQFLSQKDNLIIRSICPWLTIIPINYINMDINLFDYIIHQKVLYGAKWNQKLNVIHFKIDTTEIGDNNIDLIEDILNMDIMELEITCSINAEIVSRLLNNNVNLKQLTIDCGWLTQLTGMIADYEIIPLPNLKYLKTTGLISQLHGLNLEEFHVNNVDFTEKIRTLLYEKWSQCTILSITNCNFFRISQRLMTEFSKQLCNIKILSWETLNILL